MAYSNRVLSFNGTDERVSMGDVLGFEYTSAQSYHAWMKLNAGSTRPIVTKTAGATTYRGVHLYASNGQIVFMLSSDAAVNNRIQIVTTATFSDDVWHHVVATTDGSGTAAGCKIYVDNVLQTRTVVWDALTATILNTSPFMLGSRSGLDAFFSGRLDEVAVYSGELTASEVTWLYNGGAPRNLNDVGAPSGRRAWWRMGEGCTPPTLPDEDATYPGTMANMDASNILVDSPGGVDGNLFDIPDPSSGEAGNVVDGAVYGLSIGAPRDLIQPAIGSWSPSVGSTIDNGDAIAFNATDNLGNLARVIVIAEFTGGMHEVIHDGSSFAPYYAAGSTRTPIANGFAFSLVRAVGWAGPDLTIRIYATDTDGNEATPTGYAFTVSNPVLPDTYPPLVSNVSPAEGTPIARAASVFFDVTDDSGIFRRIIVTASFADGSSEVVHDGDNFAASYAAASTRTVIPDGFRYRVRRTGGWPYGPTIRAFAIDTSGNENS